MTDPIDLLRNYLKDIEQVNCNDPKFISYRNKYRYTIKFLEIYQIGGFFRRKLNYIEEECIRILYDNGTETKVSLKNKFFICSKTLNRILNEK